MRLFSSRSPWVVAVLLALLTGPSPALAHRVNVHAYVEGDRIVGKGYFSNGNQARQSAVEVLDAEGVSAGRAVTDDEGRFFLPLPQAQGPLRIVLKAGEGHQAVFPLALDRPAGDAGASPPVADRVVGQAERPETEGNPVRTARPEGVAPAAAMPLGTPQSAAGPSVADIERVLDKALSARLSPLAAQLAELSERQDRAALKDVFGGLGWIVGLFGLAAYFKRR